MLAMLVKLAEDIGNLHLTMRSKTDSEPRVDDKDRFKPTDMSDFLGEEEEEEGEEEEEAEPQENDDDLEQFLNANSQPDSLPESIPVAQVTSAPVVVSAEPEVPVFDSSWTIEIFAGTVKRVEEVQIPESEWPVIEPEVVTEEVDESGGNLLLKGLKSLFGNGAKQAAAEEGNQDAEVSDPLPVVNDNQSDDRNIEDSIPAPAELSEVD